MHCEHDHAEPNLSPPQALQRAAAMFRALGDPARLQLIELLVSGERCVSSLAGFTKQEMSTISQRLKILRQERLVESRRDGKQIFYALADHHVYELVQSALAHSQE